MTSFEVIQIAAKAQYRAMTDNDRSYFCDAHERTVIAEVLRGIYYYMVLCNPAGEIEVYDDDYNCWTVKVTRTN